MKHSILLVLTVTLFMACNKVSKEEQAKIDKDLIIAYVAENNLSGEFTATDLWFDIETQGTGEKAYSGAQVTVAYTGYLLDGEQFDASSDDGATFSLNNVIEGWQQGIPKFKAGGKGKLIIPSELGYGKSGSGSIPGNSVLVFDIELITVF
jgi:FKBP-type peptidyl-prolyl cis-trans isomerase FkpA